MYYIPYVKLFPDLLDALEPFGDAERGRLFTAVLVYAQTGEAPQLNGNERFLFPMLKGQIDRDARSLREQANAKSAARTEAGRKGAAARWGSAENGTCGAMANDSKNGTCHRNMANMANDSKNGYKDKDKDKDKDKEEDIPPYSPPRGGRRGAAEPRQEPEAELPPPAHAPNQANYGEIMRLYNEICTSFPRCTSLSEARKKAIRARFASGRTLEDFETVFRKAQASSFLKGGNNRNWQASFDWMLKDGNFAKILDGNYDDMKESAPAREKPLSFAEMAKRMEENERNGNDPYYGLT